MEQREEKEVPTKSYGRGNGIFPPSYFVLFIFIHSLFQLDNRNCLKRFVLIAGEGAGNSLIKTVRALSFCHVILAGKSS